MALEFIGDEVTRATPSWILHYVSKVAVGDGIKK